MILEGSLDDFAQKMADNILCGPSVVAINSADEAIAAFIGSIDDGRFHRIIAIFSLGYGSWRAAAVLNKAGNTPQVPAVLRLALESFLYAHLFKTDDEWFSVWSKRETCSASRDKFRKKGLAEARISLGQVDPKLLTICNDFIDRMISVGAHPNPEGVSNMTSLNAMPDRDEALLLFSLLGGDFERELSTFNVLWASNLILHLLRHTLPEYRTRPTVELAFQKARSDLTAYAAERGVTIADA